MDGAFTEDAASGMSIWQKLGVAGFLFFLAKGLLWVAAAALLHFLS